MEKYAKMSDEEILAEIRQQELGAIDYLCQKYKGLVKSKARLYFMPGADQEDLIQEGMIGLYRAILTYSEERECSFYTYANHVVEMQILTAIKNSNRKKNGPLNYYVSLDTGGGNEDEEGENSFLSLETVISGRNRNPEELIIDKENVAVLEYELGKRLSKLEKLVFDYSRQGLNYQEIARVLGKNPKSIDNALQRIKTKCKDVFGV